MDVKHIAKLARLGLDKEEEKKFENELAAILDFVEKLNNVDTKEVSQMANVTGAKDIFRADETNLLSQTESTKAAILENAPAKEKGYFKVKRVLE